MLTGTMFRGTSIPVLEQVVNFSQARHNVLAGNIANMDTPGYQVRDLSPQQFQQMLKEAIDTRQDQRAGPFASHGDASLRQVGANLQGILFHDLSNDSIEHQVAEMSKNQTQHNMALAIMNSQFRLLQSAISERA
jgi:flagellar basal-body rod protein FlgB